MSEKNPNNVDQIRELIFGSQIKEFEERFKQLSTTLKTVEEKLHTALSESHVTLQKETNRSLEALEKKIDNLTSATQKERVKLKELIDTTDESLQEQLNNQKDEFLTKFTILKETVSDENQKALNTIEKIRSEIEASLHAKITTLSDDKLSRDTMSQMLLDIAMKIQGTDIGTLLSEEKASEN